MQSPELACSSFLRLSSSQEFRSACLKNKVTVSASMVNNKEKEFSKIGKLSDGGN